MTDAKKDEGPDLKGPPTIWFEPLAYLKYRYIQARAEEDGIEVAGWGLTAPPQRKVLVVP